MKLRSGERCIADPLYKIIPIDAETERYIFKNDLLQVERERAQRLYNLGLVRFFFPSASHSKWEHHVGTYHVAREAKNFTSSLNSDEFRLLVHLNFYSCFGYLALGYCTAEALLQAAQTDSALKSELIQEYLGPPYAIAKQYVDVNPSFSKLDAPEAIIKNYRYKALNAWFGAYKLLSMDRKKALPKSIYTRELIAALIGETAAAKRAYYELATVEYLQRDLFYTQIVSFNIPIGRAIEDHKKRLLSRTYAELLESLRATITRDVYTEPRFFSLETLARERICQLLVDRTISIKDLITQDDAWLEEKIDARSMVRSVESGQLIVRESTLIDMAHVGPNDEDFRTRQDLRRYMQTNEKAAEHGYVVSPAVEQRSFSTSYNRFRALDVVFYSHGKPKLPRLLDQLNRLSLIYANGRRANGINANVFLHKYSREVIAFGFGQQASVEFDGLFVDLQRHCAASGIPESLAKHLDSVRTSHAASDHVVRTHDHSHHSVYSGRRFAFLLEYLVYGGIGAEVAHATLSVLDELLPSLGAALNAEPGRRFEYRCFLYLQRRFLQTGAIVCPSVKLNNDVGDTTAEIDFIVMGAVENYDIRLVECSINPGDAKVLGDAQKVAQLEESLNARFDTPRVAKIFIAAGTVNPEMHLNGVDLIELAIN